MRRVTLHHTLTNRVETVIVSDDVYRAMYDCDLWHTLETVGGRQGEWFVGRTETI